MSISTWHDQLAGSVRGLHFRNFETVDGSVLGRGFATFKDNVDEEQHMDVDQQLVHEQHLDEDVLALLAQGIVRELKAARRDLRHVSLDEMKNRITRAGRKHREAAE